MHSVTDRQTDGRHDDTNSRSYCIVVRRLIKTSTNVLQIRNWRKAAAECGVPGVWIPQRAAPFCVEWRHGCHLKIMTSTRKFGRCVKKIRAKFQPGRFETTVS